MSAGQYKNSLWIGLCAYFGSVSLSLANSNSALPPAQLVIDGLGQISSGLQAINFPATDCATTSKKKIDKVILAEGGERGGSDLQKPDANSAWFLGPSPVRYCLETTPSFGISAKDSAKSVKDALALWTHYMKERQVWMSFPEDERISTNFLELTSCDGSEDLHFYFGVTTTETEAARSKYFHPSAFVKKTSYNENSGRSKGFIWIAPPNSLSPDLHVPDWTRPYHLGGQLLHEIGHILGCEHIDGTIMRENFTELLYGNSSNLQLMQIDGTRALALPTKGADVPILGTIGAAGHELEANATFEKFTGSAPEGPVSAELKASTTDDHSFRLILRDRKITKEIPIALVRAGDDQMVFSKFFSNAAVFKTTLKGKGKSMGMSGGVAMGQAKDHAGNEHIITLDLNSAMGPSPVHISYIENGRQVDLFNSSQIGSDDARP